MIVFTEPNRLIFNPINTLLVTNMEGIASAICIYVHAK